MEGQSDVNGACQTLCNDVKLSKDQSATLAKRIRNNYYVHLYDEFELFEKELSISLFFRLVDNLPCATKFQNVETHETMYEHGYRLGIYSKQNEDLFINNHLIIKLFYHKESEYTNFER